MANAPTPPPTPPPPAPTAPSDTIILTRALDTHQRNHRLIVELLALTPPNFTRRKCVIALAVLRRVPNGAVGHPRLAGVRELDAQEALWMTVLMDRVVYWQMAVARVRAALLRRVRVFVNASAQVRVYQDILEGL